MKKISAFDIIGPVMAGPSSSHTAGALRIALIASEILKEQVHSARFTLHGSFSETYRGHGTDRALAAGIMGWSTDDPAIPRALEVAAEKEIPLTFNTAPLEPEMHPNTVSMTIAGRTGRHLELEGASVGGGDVVITKINGIQVSFTGEYPTLIVQQRDRPGIAAHITGLLARGRINIGTMRVYRQERGTRAYTVVETDDPVPESIMVGIREHPFITDVFLVT